MVTNSKFYGLLNRVKYVNIKRIIELGLKF